MNRLVGLGLVCCLVPAGLVFAQGSGAQEKTDQGKATAPVANPLSTFNKGAYVRVKGLLLKSAEKMPEENYGFKPVDSVRSYGQIVGHVADAQYLFCSIALGEKNPAPDIEHTKTTKADLIAALQTAFAYCDKAYDTMTDATAVQPVKLFGGDQPRFSALEVNNMHNLEHYGNLSTYMRMKNIVPPSTEQAQAAQAAQQQKQPPKD
jgi:uncharacterized damage-inducible protein DinB